MCLHVCGCVCVHVCVEAIHPCLLPSPNALYFLMESVSLPDLRTHWVPLDCQPDGLRDSSSVPLGAGIASAPILPSILSF